MKNSNGWWLPDQDTFFVNRPDYESLDYAALQPYLSQRRTAVDVGAHVGYWSRRLAADFEFVVAYEAEPVHAACHARNIANPNVMLHEIALSDHAGTVNFVTTILNSGMSHVSDSGDAIPCETLDSYNLDHVDLIKIDVEGHELAVLQGAAQTILQNRPVIFIEILNHTPAYLRNRIDQLFAQWNYVQSARIAENYIYVSAQ